MGISQGARIQEMAPFLNFSKWSIYIAFFGQPEQPHFGQHKKAPEQIDGFLGHFSEVARLSDLSYKLLYDWP